MMDLLLDADGDLDVNALDLRLVDGAARVRQQLQVKLLLWRGEWFLDSDFGTPYLQSILGKELTLSGALAAIRASILEVEGVQKLTKFEFKFSNATRALDVDFDVQTTYGGVSFTSTKRQLSASELIALSRSSNFPKADDDVDVLTNITIPSHGY